MLPLIDAFLNYQKVVNKEDFVNMDQIELFYSELSDKNHQQMLV